MPLRRKLAWIALLYFAEGMPFGHRRRQPARLLPRARRVARGDRRLLVARPAVDAEAALGAARRSLRRTPPLDRRRARRDGARDRSPCRSTIPPRRRRSSWAPCCALTIAGGDAGHRDRRLHDRAARPGEEGVGNGVRVSAYRAALIASGGGLVAARGTARLAAAFVVTAAVFAALAIAAWRAAPRVVVARHRPPRGPGVGRLAFAPGCGRRACSSSCSTSSATSAWGRW